MVMTMAVFVYFSPQTSIAFNMSVGSYNNYYYGKCEYTISLYKNYNINSLILSM